MRFDFYPLRFHLLARESVFFPHGKAANILRGALGVIFRRIACVPHCSGPSQCDIRESCPYARVFEPASSGAGPSGLADWPRPFVFRARHLDGCAIAPETPFHFDLHVFTPDTDVLAYFVLTFAALAREGVGPRRGRAELQRVDTIPTNGKPPQVLYEKSRQMIGPSIRPASCDLAPAASAPSRIRVDFLSPTELKHEHKIVARPEFSILFGRIRDRISTLRALYGQGPLDIDFQGASARAAAIQMVRYSMRRQDADRRSTRTGRTHSIGGFIGAAEYEGDLAEFLPYLQAAKWTGVGRHAVWGKGEIEVISSGALAG